MRATASFARVTPLGTCSFAGSLGVARVLLEHGADPHIGEDGTYTVEAVHEKLGRQTQTVTIGEKETKDVAFTFKI